jgi:hypothetical protein
MTGLVFWLLLGGLCAAMAVLMVCRGHWFAMTDAMHRAPHDLLQRLDWPREHPFDVPDPANAGARKFPVRQLRARVILFGLPHPELCPPAARRHARAFRLWGAVLLAGLVAVAAWALTPMVVIVALCLYGCGLILTPRWPKEHAA